MRIRMDQAREYCNQGLAYFLRDGRLKFRAHEQRVASDVYVEERGTIWWNGARSNYVDGKDIAAFPPGSNVLFPKSWSARAARRYRGGEKSYV